MSIDIMATPRNVAGLPADPPGDHERARRAVAQPDRHEREKSPAKVTLPLSQANEVLGCMPQSFELTPVGQQGLGFFAGGYLIVNHEDSYAIDRCFGDMVLETTLGLLEG